MLPQPGLQAEEIDVEISWRWDPASGCLFAQVFIGAAAWAVETPAHQAHLKKPESPLKENGSPRFSLAGIVILLGPAAEELVCHHLSDIGQVGERDFVLGDSLDTACPIRPCLEMNIQLAPIQGHKMSRNAQLVQKLLLVVSAGAAWMSPQSQVGPTVQGRQMGLAWVDIFTFWSSFSRAMSSP